MVHTRAITKENGFSVRMFVLQIGLTVVMFYTFIGCTTTNTAQQSLDSYFSPSTVYENRPFSEPPVNNNTYNFAQGNLPLGIGAKLNLAMSESPESTETSNFITDNIVPLRRGKLLSRTPVQMNYTIMPDSGEAFYHSGGLDNGSIKSSYDFQIGMSRHVYKASDFLNADFWLAKGKYNPNKVKRTYRHDESELNPFRSDELVDEETKTHSRVSKSEWLDRILFPNE